MNIAAVTLGTRALTTALAGAATPAYGQVLTLALATGPAADGLVLDAGAALLRGRFTPYDYDALAGGDAAFRAQLTKGDPVNTVIVTLPVPRYLLQVNLAGGVAVAGDQIEVYRVDGTAAAGQPVAAAGDGAAFDADFAGQTFALRLKRPDGGDGGYVSLRPGDVAHLYLRSYPTTPRFGLPDPAQGGQAVFFWQQAGEAIPSLAGRGSTLLAAGKGRSADDVLVRSPAAAPAAGRGGVIDARSKSERVIKGGRGGPGRVPGQADAGHADAGQPLAAALQRSLDRLAAPLPPAGLSFNLTVASDTPCTFTLDALALPYHLRRTTFAVDAGHPDGQAKQVLRFAGDQVAGQAVHVALPAAARATTATLKISPRLRPGGPAAGGATPDAVPAGAPSAALPPEEGDRGRSAAAALGGRSDGVTVGGDAWVAQPFAPPTALNASGLALGLLPLAADTTLRVEVHADWQGQPAGQALARGTAQPGAAGQRGWAIVRFAKTAVLPAAPHWLLLRASGGQAVWLAERAAGAAGIQVLEQAEAAGPFMPRSAIPGLAAAYQLLADQADAGPAVTVSLGGQALGPATAAGESLTFELSAALNSYLGAQTGAGLVTIPLTFTCAAGGVVTVYSPSIVYDV